MIVELKKTYVGPDNGPLINKIDTAIFTELSHRGCFDFDCADSCCGFGAFVDAENYKRLDQMADVIENITGIPRQEWYEWPLKPDPDYPGGSYTHSHVVKGRCVFINPNGRGCALHAYALDNGIDYHTIKPIICWIFPATYENGLIYPGPEITDKSVACYNKGKVLTVYQNSRDELLYAFGQEFIDECDELERKYSAL